MDPDKKDKKHYYPIFNKKGKAAYYLDQDKVHIYSWDGKPQAFVEKGAVWSFKQQHLGWYDEGWLRDLSGKCVGFSEAGKGGPNPPKTKPPSDPPADKKDQPEIPDIKDLPDRPPRRPVWSELSEEDFFAGKALKGKKK